MGGKNRMRVKKVGKFGIYMQIDARNSVRVGGAEARAPGQDCG